MRTIFIFILAFILCGCNQMNFKNPFTADPLTGGINANNSELLNVPIPNGFQRYVTHGYIKNSEYGSKEGLETFRGHVDNTAAATSMYNTLNGYGWQLLMSLRKGDRSTYLYHKNNEYCVIAFRKQGALTIMEIWTSPTLPKGVVPDFARTMEGNSMQGEVYEPLTKSEELRKEKSSNLGSSVEERQL